MTDFAHLFMFCPGVPERSADVASGQWAEVPFDGTLPSFLAAVDAWDSEAVRVKSFDWHVDLLEVAEWLRHHLTPARMCSINRVIVKLLGTNVAGVSRTTPLQFGSTWIIDLRDVKSLRRHRQLERDVRDSAERRKWRIVFGISAVVILGTIFKYGRGIWDGPFSARRPVFGCKNRPAKILF
jgi:hypothetical protein